jgi:hypothetical protein
MNVTNRAWKMAYGTVNVGSLSCNSHFSSGHVFKTAQYIIRHAWCFYCQGHLTTGIHLEIHKFETKHFGVIRRANIQLNDDVSKTVFASITQRLIITAVYRVLAWLIARKDQQYQSIFSSFNNDITNDGMQCVCVCLRACNCREVQFRLQRWLHQHIHI